MSVREYIGARYIPLFADPIEWDSTTAYEPLTVVKNQGSSYVSRQYVPEGIAITNTAYWILWADFNAQLEQYRQEVQRFDGRITANADAIAAETQARTEAISAEATARAEAISAEATARAEAISAEAETREAADTALSNRITANKAALDARGLNVLDYGAIGDGTTDDTAAFAACFADAEPGDTVVIPNGRGLNYRITDTITVDTPYITITGDTKPNLAWHTAGILFDPSNTNSPILFNVVQDGITFANLIMHTTGDTWPTVNYIGVNTTDMTIPDVDIYFDSVWMWNFGTAIKHVNRGLILRNCSIANTRTCIEIHENSGVTNTGQNHQRAIVIQNNRFHHIGVAIDVISSHPYGMVIEGNYADYRNDLNTLSNVLLQADASSAFHTLNISGNTVLNATQYVIHLDCEIISAIISHNTFVNRLNACAANAIYITRTNGAVISDNILGVSEQDTILIGRMDRTTVTGNKLSCSDNTGAPYGALRITSWLGNSIISNNQIQLTNLAANRTAIMYTGTSSINYAVIQNNTSEGQSGIFTNVNNATINNSKIQTTITS